MPYYDMHIKQLKGHAAYYFACACYDMKTIDELLAPHTPDNADPTDCETWGISPEEWSQAIEAALQDRLDDWTNF